MTSPWLSIVGIGEDGRDGLSIAAQRQIEQARLVVGGKRHLALVGPTTAETMAWPSPLSDALPKILQRRGEPVCVLASGDPFFYGVGTMLADVIPASEIICLPTPSSFSLAAARLGWSMQNCRLLSMHGRDLRRIIPHLQPGAKLICLTWDGATPRLIAEMLRDRGFGDSTIHVLEALGGPRAKYRAARADHFDLGAIDPLNIAAIDIEPTRHGRYLPITPGLSDEWFEHDGQLTKQTVRAMTLAALRPFRGAHLWDVGAGSGAIAIEWSLLDPANRATAIESKPDRSERIARNAGALGVPDLAIVTARAPEALADLPTPDAVFIGGGASEDNVMARCWSALAPGGRLVINAVTLETQALLIRWHGEHGGELTTIALSHADPVGRFHGWRPAMPVTQWSVTKP